MNFFKHGLTLEFLNEAYYASIKSNLTFGLRDVRSSYKMIIKYNPLLRVPNNDLSFFCPYVHSSYKRQN